MNREIKFRIFDTRNNKDKDGDWLFLSSKQLLEIYKKEKLL